RAARRDAWVPDPAVPLGQRADAGSQKAVTQNPQGGPSEARQVRGHHAPDPEYLLPAHGGALGADVAGDDRAVLHGCVSDVFPGFAADHRFVLVAVRVLSGSAE